ncbi:MAG: pinensin family lanthipeptide [Cyclobacteriaceae bacterium]
MKKKNLKISDLKIQSFVTSMEDESGETVKGGYRSNFGGCDTVDGSFNGPAICQNTICPDRSICDPACLTREVIFCP